MPDWSTLVAFAAATVALLPVPGPAVFYTLNRSLADGRRVGLAGASGEMYLGLGLVAATSGHARAARPLG